MAKTQKNSFAAKNIASAALLGLFAFLAVGSINTTDSATDKTASEQSSYDLTADQLYTEYEANKVAAESKYNNKVVTITGPIQRIGRELAGRAYLVIGGSSGLGLDGVQCLFPEGQESAISQLSGGQSVTAKGKVSGQFVGNVVVDLCKLQ